MATARLMVRDHRIVLADLDRTRLDDALFAYSDIAHYSVGTLRGQQFLTAKPISLRQAQPEHECLRHDAITAGH